MVISDLRDSADNSTSDYLLTRDDTDNTLSYDANVRDAEEKGIPVIKLQMLKEVLLGKISLDDLV